MAKMRLLGASVHRGEIDGYKYDYSKFYFEVPLDTSKGTAVGSACVEIRGSSDLYPRCVGLNLPADVEATIDTVATGKGGLKQLVSDVRPVNSSLGSNKVA